MKILSFSHRTIIDFLDQKVVELFCRCLFLALFLRIVFSINVIQFYKTLFPPVNLGPLKSVFYAPHIFIERFPDVAIPVLLIFCILSILLPLNFIFSSGMLMISFSLLPMASGLFTGADLVLTIFIFYAWTLILLKNRLNNFIGQSVTISDTIFFIFKIHIGFIYFQSGIDKIFSDYWHNGDALYMATLVPGFVPDYLRFDLPDYLYLIFSWAVILFELLFIILIWFSPTRKFILAIGIIFELCIFYVFSIPDFALVMLCGYIPFLRKSPPIREFFRRTNSLNPVT